jgi:hypothetical protein
MPLRIPFRQQKQPVQESAVQPEISDNQVVREPTIQPEEIRNLGELIRKRYELDIEIWGLRGVGRRDRPIVEDKMRKSDAILSKIQRTIVAWDSPNVFESAADWDKMKEIKRRIEADGKRNWADQPPWIK